MKIIKKPKILPCTCEVCKCVFLPSRRDLRKLLHPTGKDTVHCPMCGEWTYVQFEEGKG